MAAGTYGMEKPNVAPGWEIEGGARYMFSSGRAQWEQAFPATPTWFSSSKLTWNNMQSNSSELFGRVDNLFDLHYQNPTGFLAPGLGVFGGIRVATRVN